MTTGGSRAMPRSRREGGPVGQVRSGRPHRAPAHRRRGRVAGSSPSAMTRRACSSWLTRWRWAELRDRVAEGVVERAEGLLAAVEMDDRDAIDGRGERRGGGLEPVADEHEGVDRVAPGARRRPRASGRARPGRPAGGRPSRSSSQASTASGSKPSSRIRSTVRPWRADRCVPPASRRRRRSGARGSRRRSSGGSPSPGGRSSGRRSSAAGQSRDGRGPSAMSWSVDRLSGRDRVRRPAARRAVQVRAAPVPVPGRSATRSAALIAAARRERARPVEAPPRDSRDRPLGLGRPLLAVAERGLDAPRMPATIARERRRARATPRDPGPAAVRSSVRCFSMMAAPSATAARGSSIPRRVVRPADRARRTRRRIVADRPQVGIRRRRPGSSRRSGTARPAGRRRRRSHRAPAATSTHVRPSRSRRASAGRDAASAGEERQVRELARRRP